MNIIFLNQKTKLTASILKQDLNTQTVKKNVDFNGTTQNICKFNINVFITCTPISYTPHPHASILQHRQTCQHPQPERISGQFFFFTDLSSFTCQYVGWKRLAPKICVLCVGLSQSAICCCVFKHNFSDVFLTQVSCHMSEFVPWGSPAKQHTSNTQVSVLLSTLRSVYCYRHSGQHRFQAPSLKEGCRKLVLGVWSVYCYRHSGQCTALVVTARTPITHASSTPPNAFLSVVYWHTCITCMCICMLICGIWWICLTSTLGCWTSWLDLASHCVVQEIHTLSNYGNCLLSLSLSLPSPLPPPPPLHLCMRTHAHAPPHARRTCYCIHKN